MSRSGGERGPQGAAERPRPRVVRGIFGASAVEINSLLKYETEQPGFPSGSSLFRKWHAAPQKSFSVQNHSQNSIQDVKVHEVTDVRKRMVLSYKNVGTVSTQILLHDSVRRQKIEWYWVWRN